MNILKTSERNFKASVVTVKSDEYSNVLSIRNVAYRKYNICDRLVQDAMLDTESIILLLKNHNIPIATVRLTATTVPDLGMRKYIDIPDKFVSDRIFEISRLARIDSNISSGKLLLPMGIALTLRTLKSMGGADGFVAYSREELVNIYKNYGVKIFGPSFYVDDKRYKYRSFYLDKNQVSLLWSVIQFVPIIFRNTVTTNTIS